MDENVVGSIFCLMRNNHGCLVWNNQLHNRGTSNKFAGSTSLQHQIYKCKHINGPSTTQVSALDSLFDSFCEHLFEQVLTMSALRGLLLVTLPLLSLLGYYNTFHTLNLNGTGSLLSAIVDSGPSAKLPGTESPLLRSYTHIKPLDEVLTFLVTFFAPIVDGRLDGYARWGLGQFGAAWTVIVMEGLRNGNNGRLVSW
jgi:hypothetical protein